MDTNDKKNNGKKGKLDSQISRYVKKMWIIAGFIIAFVYVFFILVSIGLLGKIPSFKELENPSNNLASEIITCDGEVIGKFYIENRTNVEYQNLAPSLVDALVATEDVRFYKHSGVDFKGILRVITKTIVGGDRSSGGGSTISQQLAKNLFKRDKGLNTFQLVGIKFREWVTAIRLERNYTKEEIIAMYLNTVDFGSQSFGIKAAAKTYFDKSADSLEVQESAMLIGMLKAPTYYNPIRNPENAKKRRTVVLSQMCKYGKITDAEFEKFNNTPLTTDHFEIQDHNAGSGTYFREHLRSLMNKQKPDKDDFYSDHDYKLALDCWENDPLYGWCNKNKKSDGSKYNLYTDGLKIYTTIDSRMQKYAEEAMSEHIGKDLQPKFYKEVKNARFAPYTSVYNEEEYNKLLNLSKHRSDRYIEMKRAGYSTAEIDKAFNTPVHMSVFSWKGEIPDTVMTPMDSIKYYKWFLRSGFMAVEPQTGAVKAYVGGINYKYFKYDNVCDAHRQVGSTFKPFVYASAMMDKTLSPCSKIPMIPVTVELEDGKTWTPKNSGKVEEGKMVTLRAALAGSINWASAYLIKNHTSPSNVKKLAQKMGIKSFIPEVYAIALGVPELTVYEMVGAQTTYANKGHYVEPIFVTRIEDKNGNVISTFKSNTNEAMDEETAYLMLELMKGVVDHGTSGRIRSKYGIKYPVAGKTGTSDDNSDGWFMGITPELVGGCWVGGEDMQIHFISTAYGQGANMALPIWALFMKKVYADSRLKIFTGDFDSPSKPLSVEIDCAKYKEENLQSNDSGFE